MPKKSNPEENTTKKVVLHSAKEILNTLEKNNFFEKYDKDIDFESIDPLSIQKITRAFVLWSDEQNITAIDGVAAIEGSINDPQFQRLYDFFQHVDMNDNANNIVICYDMTKYWRQEGNASMKPFDSPTVIVKPLNMELDEENSLYRFVYKPLENFKILQTIDVDKLKIDGVNYPLPKMIATGAYKNPAILPWDNFATTADDVQNTADFVNTLVEMSKPGGKLPDGVVEDPLSPIDRNFVPLKKHLNGKRFTMVEVAELFSKYVDPKIPKLSAQYTYELLETIINFLDCEAFTIKYDLLDIYMQDRETPLRYIISQLTHMLTMQLEINNDIDGRLSQKLGRQQQEFIVREKIKQLQEYLEEMGGSVEDDDYTKTLKNTKLRKIYPESVIKLIADEEKRSSEMMPASPEAAISKNYTNILKKLPWRKVQRELLEIKHAKEILDQYHYGLDEIKERILEYLAVLINVKKQNKDKDEYEEIDDKYLIDNDLFKEDGKNLQEKYNNVPILTLVGPPGTGKTSLSKAIAEALGREFLKISLGGVHDESEIRGHRRTYVGAMPGKIIKGITKAGVSNPVILLDEIDKMASDFKGDPASAMLEVLDPEQNTKFQDHYLEHEYDLSKCIFIATANYFENIPPALVDRVEIIELSSYTVSEKVNIAKKYLVPKVLQQAGLDAKMFSIDEQTLEYIIKHYTMEAGVRGLKRILDKIARKIVLKKLNNPKLTSFKVQIKGLEDLLGVIKFKDEEKEEDQLPGIVTGLAYTSYGGSTLPIEVTTYEGKSEIKLTGSLKEVMQESAQIALTYVRANAKHFGIDNFDFEANTIHIHVPEGAVPKDGPSAGVTFTTAIISALSKRAVSNEIGMTGEITLRGKVLEIGGLKEKSFAASSKGLKRIFIPAGNVKNLKDIPLEIKEKLEYIPVKNYEEIYSVIFEGKEPKEIITFNK
ncbi:endopeptidase La [Mycoplasma sp. 005V]|uniref:endopeptidase La n=1 Tax=unclassified Mycoplasma TaxID=2683645 RepID=UPI003A855539